MAGIGDFDGHLAEGLELIDGRFRDQHRALKDRPLWAARDFVELFVQEVGIGGERSVPGEFMDYVGTDWFKVIYARTVAWYRERYGAAVAPGAGRSAIGCIVALGAAFAIHVPVVTRRPGTPGETIWVCFPDHVEADEDAVAWIEAGPNIAALPRGDGLKLRRLSNEVSTALRSIHTGLGSVEATTDRVGQLRDAILPHLERAATQIVRSRPEDLKHAHWDLQMACELSLKLLAEQRAGTFAESHDLYHLFDQLEPGPVPFRREILANIPRWERMAEWRYGGGAEITVAEAFSRYRTTLRIVRAVAEAAQVRYRIGGMRIEIRRAPYLHEDPDMYGPLPGRAAPRA